MQKNNLTDIEPLFKQNFAPLAGFAMKYVHDLDTAKNIVHEAFIALWEKLDDLPDDTNYRSYLYTSTRNRCLNFIRDQKKTVEIDSVRDSIAPQTSDHLEVKELETEIALAISSLPEKCREVFEASRMEGLKYADIAKKMNISTKTVEAQMSKALRILRENLGDYLVLLIIMNFG